MGVRPRQEPQEGLSKERKGFEAAQKRLDGRVVVVNTTRHELFIYHSYRSEICKINPLVVPLYRTETSHPRTAACQQVVES